MVRYRRLRRTPSCGEASTAKGGSDRVAFARVGHLTKLGHQSNSGGRGKLPPLNADGSRSHPHDTRRELERYGIARRGLDGNAGGRPHTQLSLDECTTNAYIDEAARGAYAPRQPYREVGRYSSPPAMFHSSVLTKGGNREAAAVKRKRQSVTLPRPRACAGGASFRGRGWRCCEGRNQPALGLGARQSN